MEKKTPFKELSTSQKVDYIMDYYKIHIIVAIIIIIAVVSIVRDITSKKDTVINCLMINFVGDETSLDESFDEFLEKNNYNPDKDEVSTNTALSLDVSDQTSFQQMFTLNSLMASSTYSGFFSDSKTFNHYAEQSYFIELEKVVSEELMNKYKDYIIYGVDTSTGKKYPCGVKLTKDNCKWLKSNDLYDECYMGFCFSDESKESISQFAEFILQ